MPAATRSIVCSSVSAWLGVHCLDANETTGEEAGR